MPPTFSDINIKHDLPSEIKIVSGGVDLSGVIQIMPPSNPLPTEIYVINRDVPHSIELISDVPSIIRIEHDLPNKIIIESLAKIPSIIKIDGSSIPDTIKVVGFPETIQLVGPSEIKLTIDEDLEVPLVYRGAPIELKLEMPKEWLADDSTTESKNCFMLIPCGPR